jgi:RimJ/RimL family protein N-acetyltransferase
VIAEFNASIGTRRLALEPLLGSHAAALFPILSDPATQRWIPAPRSRTPEELEALWRAREDRRGAQDGDASLAWALRRREDGALVGKADAYVDGTGVATNLGYVIGPAHWSNGYATEAVGAIVGHLFACGVVEVRATVGEGNVASWRVLERNGFERVAEKSSGDWEFARRAIIRSCDSPSS